MTKDDNGNKPPNWIEDLQKAGKVRSGMRCAEKTGVQDLWDEWSYHLIRSMAN
jgi:hypothetical protein